MKIIKTAILQTIRALSPILRIRNDILKISMLLLALFLGTQAIEANASISYSKGDKRFYILDEYAKASYIQKNIMLPKGYVSSGYEMYGEWCRDSTEVVCEMSFFCQADKEFLEWVEKEVNKYIDRNEEVPKRLGNCRFLSAGNITVLTQTLHDTGLCSFAKMRSLLDRNDLEAAAKCIKRNIIGDISIPLEQAANNLIQGIRSKVLHLYRSDVDKRYLEFRGKNVVAIMYGNFLVYAYSSDYEKSKCKGIGKCKDHAQGAMINIASQIVAHIKHYYKKFKFYRDVKPSYNVNFGIKSPLPKDSNRSCPVIIDIKHSPQKPKTAHPFKLVPIVKNPDNIPYTIRYKSFNKDIQIRKDSNGATIVKPGDGICYIRIQAKITPQKRCRYPKLYDDKYQFTLYYYDLFKSNIEPIFESWSYEFSKDAKELIFHFQIDDPDGDKLNLYRIKPNDKLEKIASSQAGAYLTYKVAAPKQKSLFRFGVSDGKCGVDILPIEIDPANSVQSQTPLGGLSAKFHISLRKPINGGEQICFTHDMSVSKGIKRLWSLDGVMLKLHGRSVCVRARSGKHRMQLELRNATSKQSSSLDFFVQAKKHNSKKAIKAYRFIYEEDRDSDWNRQVTKAHIGKSVCIELKLSRDYLQSPQIEWIDEQGVRLASHPLAKDRFGSCVTPKSKGRVRVKVSLGGKELAQYTLLLTEEKKKRKKSRAKESFHNSKISEAWSHEWSLSKVIEEANGDNGRIPGSNQRLGWKSEAKRIGDANPPAGAHGALYYTHPKSRSEATVLKRELYVDSANEALYIRIAGNQNGDFLFKVLINGKKVLERVIDGKRWHEIRIPLNRYAHQKIDIELDIEANGWYYEYAYIDEIKIINKRDSNYQTLKTGIKSLTPKASASKRGMKAKRHFGYLGCYKDSGDPLGTEGRDLDAKFVSDASMTIEKCLDICLTVGYPYAGVEYGTQCFCGRSYGKFGKADNCDMACGGDSSEICGGFWAIGVYATSPQSRSKGLKPLLHTPKGSKDLQKADRFECIKAYKEFVKAYNRLTGLMGMGRANSSEAKDAYRDYLQKRKLYERCNREGISDHGKAQSSHSPKEKIIYNSADTGENFLSDRAKNSRSTLGGSGVTKQSATQTKLYFRDDFNFFDSNRWEAYEWQTLRKLPSALVYNGVLDLRCDRTDRSAFVVSKAIRIKRGDVVRIRRRVRVHYANRYFEGGVWFYQSATPELQMPANRAAWHLAFGNRLFNVSYYHYYYEKPGVRQYVPAKDGFVIQGKNWKSERNYRVFPPIWDRWFIEEIVYDSASGIASYKINGKIASVKTIAFSGPYIRFIMHSYGWFTGHDIKVDWVELSVNSKGAAHNQNGQILVDSADMFTNNSRNSISKHSSSKQSISNSSSDPSCRSIYQAYISSYNRLTQGVANENISHRKLLDLLHRYRKDLKRFQSCYGSSKAAQSSHRLPIQSGLKRCQKEYSRYMKSYERIKDGMKSMDDLSFLRAKESYLRAKKSYEACLRRPKSEMTTSLDSSAKKGLRSGVQKSIAYGAGPITNVLIALKARSKTQPDLKSITDLIPNGNTPFYIFIYYQGARPSDRLDALWYLKKPGAKEELLFKDSGGHFPSTKGVIRGGPITVEGGSFPAGRYRLLLKVNGKRAFEKFFEIR